MQRVLAGQAPGNIVALLTRYCGLDEKTWGKDAFGGIYPWLERTRASTPGSSPMPEPRPELPTR